MVNRAHFGVTLRKYLKSHKMTSEFHTYLISLRAYIDTQFEVSDTGIAVFWDVKLCSIVDIYQHLGETYCHSSRGYSRWRQTTQC
jgi:hypothetical protein